MRVCWDDLHKLRYNRQKGKWYKDRYRMDKVVGTTAYLLNENGCQICGDWFFYAPHNEGKFCSLSCTTKYRNSVVVMKEETKKKISQTKTGVSIWSEKDKKNMKHRLQNQLWKGKGNPAYNEKLKEKRRQTVIKNGSYLGENNPMYGRKGYKSPQWKGGITPKNAAIRNTLEFKNWRRAVYNRDQFTCQECGVKGKYLNAHHIKTFADYPELRFEVSNGITLCEDCHKKIKGKEKLYEEKYYSIILYGVVTGRMLGYG